jgi:hypothetical protein
MFAQIFAVVCKHLIVLVWGETGSRSVSWGKSGRFCTLGVIVQEAIARLWPRSEGRRRTTTVSWGRQIWSFQSLFCCFNRVIPLSKKTQATL